jgi:alpha-galactosidase
MNRRRFGSAVLACLVSALLGGSTIAKEPPLAATPPMGWSSWNRFACNISEAIVRAQADAMIRSGMQAVGYRYVNIDDCWQGRRDSKGYIHSNSKFPDIKGLADYLHGKGLKLGLYSTPGPKTCEHNEGSYGHEEQDAQTYASWGVDYLKYDYCSTGAVYTQDQLPMAYGKMHDALMRAGRPIVFSIHARGKVWEWGPVIGANLWRTTDDIQDNYNRMALIGFGQAGLATFAGPGHWNDPDMLEIGNGGMTNEEYRMHMSLWCLLAAPLIAGNDLTRMTPRTRSILTNPEVIAVDQDPAGIQGHRVSEVGPLEVWMKPLGGGSKAIGLFNKEQGTLPVTMRFRDIGLGEAGCVRDLWSRKDLGRFETKFTARVPQRGVVMIRVSRCS